MYWQKPLSNSVFQPFENLYLKIVSPIPTMIGPMVDSGCERMSITLSVNSG